MPFAFLKQRTANENVINCYTISVLVIKIKLKETFMKVGRVTIIDNPLTLIRSKIVIVGTTV